MSDKPRSGAVLAYHEVMPQSKYSYCVTRDSFAQHLLLLRSSPAQVTFDDGEESQRLYAAPLLAAEGVQATFFVTPGLIGTARKFMRWRDLKDLRNEGHSVQSHGWSHQFLTVCSHAELLRELWTSRTTLEDRLGAAVEEISMPGGRWDRRVLAACAQAGYKRVYVSEPWIAVKMCSVEVRGRFMVRRTTTPAGLKRILRQDCRTIWALKMRSQVKQSFISLVGDDRYHRLWCRLTGYNEFEEAHAQESCARPETPGALG